MRLYIHMTTTTEVYVKLNKNEASVSIKSSMYVIRTQSERKAQLLP